MSTNITIYVSGGNFAEPYYDFYLDSEGDYKLSSLILNSNLNYTFKRLNEEISHPFFISDRGVGNLSSSSISINGDGSFISGIKGDQTFTLTFNKDQAEISDLTFYCTSHSNMQSSFNVQNWDPDIFDTREQLDTVVHEWIDDQTAATATYGDINNWDVSGITDFSELFKDKTTFNSDISNWNVSSGNNFRSMFSGAEAFNQDIGSWNVSSGTDFSGMFYDAEAFDQKLSLWDVNSEANLSDMFLDSLASTNQVFPESINISYFAATTGDDTITGTANVDDSLRGHDGHDTLYGLAGSDNLFGDGGNDTLDGGLGNDSMSGGDGDDTYFVDSISDTVTENTAEGTDTIHSSVTYTAAANVENLILTGSSNINGTGNSSDNTITGNSGANRLNGGAGRDILVGNAGNDVLIGGPGIDDLRGGIGNDIYIVDNSGDIIGEGSYQGNDLAYSSTHYYIRNNNVENLTLTGSSNINGTGNSSDNTITGNSGSNRLNGGAGRDILVGNAGHDVLIGGPGIDDLQGGIGNDIYIVDNSGDIIGEGSNQGNDLVYSSTHYYIRNNNVENLTLTGSSNINGTGNSSANIIKGNSGVNRLNGGTGRDILVGNAGNDVLIGGSGIDDLRGGIGNDIYIVDNSGDIIGEGSKQGNDLVYSSTHYYIRNNNVENLTLTGSSNINGTGNSSDNIIKGNSGVNRLNGGAGRDILIGNAGNDVLIGGPGIDDLRGGIGNDIYIVDNSGDIIGEGSNQGTDLVYSSTHYYIRNNNVENLTLTGSSNINGTGNSSANIITGNSGANRLNGGAGRDILVGNAGNDVLIGGSGIDDLRGGIGNDIYIVDNSGDIIGEGFNQGNDLVYSSTHYYIRNNNVENLTLTGSSNINGTGNSSDNKITGNSGSNRLNGGAGLDILVGNAGNDVLFGGSGNDRLVGGDGIDTLTGGIGDDSLTGGVGNDIFQINIGAGRDVITDYEDGGDKIRLLGGLTSSDLTFSSVGGYTSIKKDDDLLAIVQNTIAADITFI